MAKKLIYSQLLYSEGTKSIHIEVWQDKDRTWLEVDRVYETRWDCMLVPEGVRLVA